MKWEKVRLGEIASISAGQGAPQGEHNYCDNGTPFIKAGNLSDLLNGLSEYEVQNVSEDIAKTHKLKLFNKGTIVFAKSGMSCLKGYVYELKNDCYVVNHLACISTSKLRSTYLKYFFERFPPNELIKDESYPSISLSDISDITVPIPAREIQNKIVEVLDKSQKLIDKRKKQIELLDQFVKSTFIQMFGDPVTNPKGWDLTTLGEYINVLTDYHANGSYEILREHVELLDKEDFALMIRTTDLENGNFTQGVKYISKSAYEFLTKTKVFGGELIINKIGSAGKVYLMPELNRPVSLAMNQFMVKLGEYTNNIYAYYFLNTKYSAQNISDRVQGAVTKTITKDAVRSIPFYNPPIELQNQFAEVVRRTEKQRELLMRGLEKLERNYKSLMQKAFSGELFQ